MKRGTKVEAVSRELGYVLFAWQRYMTQQPPFVSIRDPRDFYLRL